MDESSSENTSPQVPAPNEESAFDKGHNIIDQWVKNRQENPTQSTSELQATITQHQAAVTAIDVQLAELTVRKQVDPVKADIDLENRLMQQKQDHMQALQSLQSQLSSSKQ